MSHILRVAVGPKVHLLTFLLASISVTLIQGCDRFGIGGTGEMVVPPERFHQVQATEFPVVSTQPSTNPTTNPTVDNPPPELVLSLQECRAIALQNNLDLKVNLYQPAIAYTSVTEEQAAFEAVFGSSVSYQHNIQPAPPGGSAIHSENIQADANLGIPLRSGGSIRFDLPVNRLTSDGALPSQNPSYLATPSIAFNQPLLRGFGPDVNAQGIRLAFYAYQQSEAATKLEVIRVLAETDHVYWQLYAARRLLEVRKKEYDLASAQLERSRHQAAAGVIAEVDIVRAESGVADQVEQIIIAQSAVRQQERDLKRILNKPGLEMDTRTMIVPATRPTDLPFALERKHIQDAAVAQRMEMLEIELQIAQETANIRFARNQMLPLLAFAYTYGINGAGTTVSGVNTQLWTKGYDDHIVGLQLQIPIGNEAAHSQLRRAMLARLQQLASREQRASQVRQEVLDAIDNVETDWQRILASRKRVDLASRTLDVETHQFDLGLRTSTDVLDAQSSLASAQSAEVSAVTDYQNAQVDLAVATGTTLGATGVTFQPVIYGRKQ